MSEEPKGFTVKDRRHWAQGNGEAAGGNGEAQPPPEEPKSKYATKSKGKGQPANSVFIDAVYDRKNRIVDLGVVVLGGPANDNLDAIDLVAATGGDSDGDGIDDAVDFDRDDDGVGNGSDNCPDAANPSQSNNDANATFPWIHDGVGPEERRKHLRGRLDVVQLDREQHDVDDADLVRIAERADARNVDVALRADDAQPAGAERVEVRATREERHVRPRRCEPSAKIAADAAAAYDRDAHRRRS